MHTKFILKDEISFHVVHVYRGMESFSSCLKFHPTRSKKEKICFSQRFHPEKT